MDDDFDGLVSEANELGKAILRGPIAGEPELYGSAAFFAAATETLVSSTKQRRELGGACYFVRKGDAIVLVGIEKLSQGKATHVAVNPAWGAILWHTHPGLSFSIAAFSEPDIEGAKVAGRPLLVIGYRSASPDVLGLTQAARLVRGQGDAISERLLHMGVGAQVCWPSGVIRPIRRYNRTGLREALDTATFQVDRAIGAAARVVNPTTLKTWSSKLKEAVQKRSRKG